MKTAKKFDAKSRHGERTRYSSERKAPRRDIEAKDAVVRIEPDSMFNEIAVADYESCRERINLFTSEQIKDLLIMQTIEGHSRKGHGEFSTYGRSYLNAGVEDVVSALEKSNKFGITLGGIKEERQILIDDIYRWAERAIDYSLSGGRKKTLPLELRQLRNENGEALMGVPFFYNYQVSDPLAVLKGIFLGSRMDSIKYREMAMERFRGTKYEIKMGGGECVAFDMKKLRNTNIIDVIDEYNMFPNTPDGKLNVDFLSKNSLEQYIPKLVEMGIVLDSDAKSTQTVRNGYVRHKVGNGVSDDLAIIIAGYKYGIDAAMGVYLIDAVDTLDKYVPTIVHGGLDERLGTIIQERIPSIGTDQEITAFIRLIAKSENDSADSSQRRFLQIDPLAKKSALESHLQYVTTGKGESEMLFGFDQIPSRGFYDKTSERLKMIYEIE
jgi:hypothetical protein